VVVLKPYGDAGRPLSSCRVDCIAPKGPCLVCFVLSDAYSGGGEKCGRRIRRRHVRCLHPKYSQLPPEIKVYAPGGTGVCFSMRKHRHSLTQQTATQHFSSSMVFVSPKYDPQSHLKEQEKNVALLLSNPSLVLTVQSSVLLVFTSNDLLHP
jgi:hypothetical protein